MERYVSGVSPGTASDRCQCPFHEHEWKRTTAFLASDHDNLPVTVLIDGQSAIAAVFLIIRWFDITRRNTRHQPKPYRKLFRPFSRRRARLADFVCKRTNAVLYWQSRSRQSCSALCPSAPFTKSAVAKRSHGLGACGSRRSSRS